MDKDEAREILTEALAPYRTQTYELLQRLIEEQDLVSITADSGVDYELEFNIGGSAHFRHGPRHVFCHNHGVAFPGSPDLKRDHRPVIDQRNLRPIRNVVADGGDLFQAIVSTTRHRDFKCGKFPHVRHCRNGAQ